MQLGPVRDECQAQVGFLLFVMLLSWTIRSQEWEVTATQNDADFDTIAL